MEQRADKRNSEETTMPGKKSNITDTPVVVFHTGFILLIQLVVIWVFCS